MHWRLDAASRIHRDPHDVVANATRETISISHRERRHAMRSNDPFWSRALRHADKVLLQSAEVTMDPASLAARFFAVKVLSSEPIKGIAFGLPYCSIDPDIFAEIRSAIIRGGIRMGIMGPGDPDFEHAQAVYDPDQDLIKIAAGDWEKRHRYRTALVHEAVHAHHDMAGRSDLRVHQSEEASYIAETVYTRCWSRYRKSEIRPSFLCDASNADYNAIYRPAWALALRIVDAEETTIPEGDSDLLELREALRMSDLYRDSFNHLITANRLRW
jgi:hypothetical protein